LRESSAVLILALLLSPVTWVQHLVWLVPAIYLIMTDAWSNKSLGKPAMIALSIYVILVVGLNYETLGRKNFAILLSYHPFTVAMLLVLAMLVFTAKRPGQVTAPRSTTELHLPNETGMA
jgi:alpha-1,2-mannosyltransferase